MSLNKIQLIGRLGRDPEKAQAGTVPVCNFNVAVSYKGKSGEQTEWFRCKAFEKLADNVAQFTTKGSLVYVEGRIQSRKYTTKEGAEKEVTEVIASTVQFLDSKKKETAPEAAAPAAVSNDDIPF